MNKDKEWLLTELRIIDSTINNNEFVFGYETAIDLATELVKQLDEPEKIVIPHFVADWWERDEDSVTLYGGLSVGKKSKLYLISKFYDMGLGDYLSKVEDWIDENDSTFLDLLNGKPYEVEKEPLYLIRFGDDQYALKDCEGGIRSILVFKSYASHFTRVEIDELGIEYWGFVIPVEENT